MNIKARLEKLEKRNPETKVFIIQKTEQGDYCSWSGEKRYTAEKIEEMKAAPDILILTVDWN